MPPSANGVASLIASARSDGKAWITNQDSTQPPSRLPKQEPTQNLARSPGVADFAATTETGTRKPSVNSSLCPSSRATKPKENASPPSSALSVCA